MTDYLARIAKLAEEATLGPWEARKWDGLQWPDRRWSVGVANHSTGGCVAISPRYADPTDCRDAALIAEAPRMAALLAVAGEMAEAARKTCDAVDEWQISRHVGDLDLEFRKAGPVAEARTDLRAALARWRKEVEQ